MCIVIVLSGCCDVPVAECFAQTLVLDGGMSHLCPSLLDRALKSAHLPELEIQPEQAARSDRRDMLRWLGLGALCFVSQPASAALVFENQDHQAAANSTRTVPASTTSRHAALGDQLGVIPSDFWERPRSIRLRRHRLAEEVDVVYWKDGRLLAEGYWKACALLRDVRVNRMTAMDPTTLDILYGIQGYYKAWRWNQPIIVTSGFRTQQTNNSLLSEGAKKNSLHLYGKAVDCFMDRITPDNLARLALHLRSGGVGFYPNNNFVHIDSGRLRYWRG